MICLHLSSRGVLVSMREVYLHSVQIPRIHLSCVCQSWFTWSCFLLQRVLFRSIYFQLTSLKLAFLGTISLQITTASLVVVQRQVAGTFPSVRWRVCWYVHRSEVSARFMEIRVHSLIRLLLWCTPISISFHLFLLRATQATPSARTWDGYKHNQQFQTSIAGFMKMPIFSNSIKLGDGVARIRLSPHSKFTLNLLPLFEPLGFE
jgi:hypothetical protein